MTKVNIIVTIFPKCIDFTLQRVVAEFIQISTLSNSIKQSPGRNKARSLGILRHSCVFRVGINSGLSLDFSILLVLF